MGGRSLQGWILPGADGLWTAGLTTWLIWDTFDWRIVTASPIEGFLEVAEAQATVDLKALLEMEATGALVVSFENILFI